MTGVKGQVIGQLTAHGAAVLDGDATGDNRHIGVTTDLPVDLIGHGVGFEELAVIDQHSPLLELAADFEVIDGQLIGAVEAIGAVAGVQFTAVHGYHFTRLVPDRHDAFVFIDLLHCAIFISAVGERRVGAMRHHFFEASANSGDITLVSSDIVT